MGFYRLLKPEMTVTIFHLTDVIQLVRFTLASLVLQRIHQYVPKSEEMALIFTPTLVMMETMFTKMDAHQPAPSTLDLDVEAVVLACVTIALKSI
jgi:hypothetical protein